MSTRIYESIEKLIQYGLKTKLIEQWDMDFVRNQLLEILGLDDFEQIPLSKEPPDTLHEILDDILDWAAKNGKLAVDTITYRDLLDTKLMGCFVPAPSVVIERFNRTYGEEGPESATHYFYGLSKESNYIRTDRIAKNEQWFSRTAYGSLEITINLSKPEKDPTAIAAAKKVKSAGYPKCLLCKENVGYAGRVNHPARQNHRIIPVDLKGEQWFLQFSPYVYYNEHAIVLSGEHRPMKISKEGFDRLLDYVRQYPHYFIGSNADLPIVGGSILSHDHFQAGNHEFPMAKAEMEKTFTLPGYEDIEVGIVRWPMSVLRLKGKNAEQIGQLAGLVLDSWKSYSDEQVDILSQSGDIPHNTITPIARRKGEDFELDLVLRNNRTNDEHPLGIFHPHHEVHHIKKENIGLIEVMGLAVLPGRLQEEMNLLAEYLLDEEKVLADKRTAKHADWAKTVIEHHPQLNSENIHNVLCEEVGRVFSVVLEHAGVYKRTEEGQAAFERFVDYVRLFS